MLSMSSAVHQARFLSAREPRCATLESLMTGIRVKRLLRPLQEQVRERLLAVAIILAGNLQWPCLVCAMSRVEIARC